MEDIALVNGFYQYLRERGTALVEETGNDIIFEEAELALKFLNRYSSYNRDRCKDALVESEEENDVGLDYKFRVTFSVADKNDIIEVSDGYNDEIENYIVFLEEAKARCLTYAFLDYLQYYTGIEFIAKKQWVLHFKYREGRKTKSFSFELENDCDMGEVKGKILEEVKARHIMYKGCHSTDYVEVSEEHFEELTNCVGDNTAAEINWFDTLISILEQRLQVMDEARTKFLLKAHFE